MFLISISNQMNSSSDPSSLNLSTRSVEAMVGDAVSQRSESQSLSNTRKSSGRRSICQVTKSLPKPSESELGKSVAVVSTSRAPSPASQSSQLPTGNPANGPYSSVQNTIEYHDMRPQQVNVGIDPMVFANMLSEARKMVQESEDRVQGLEQLAQDGCKQACVRMQELVNVAENLYQSFQFAAPDPRSP